MSTDEVRPLLDAAAAQLHRGDVEQALQTLHEALRLDGDHVEVHYRLGILYAGHLRDDVAAEVAFLQVVDLDATHADAMKRLVDLRLRLNKPREAIETLNRLIQVAPENQVIKDQIVAEYKKRVHDHPEDAQSRFTLGVLYRELGLLDHAIEMFQETRKVRELVLPSYSILGLCFAAKKGFNMKDLAIKQYSKGLEAKGYRDEEYQELRYNKAMLQIERMEYDEACQLIEEIYSLDIDYRDVRYWVGWCRDCNPDDDPKSPAGWRPPGAPPLLIDAIGKPWRRRRLDAG